MTTTRTEAATAHGAPGMTLLDLTLLAASAVFTAWGATWLAMLCRRRS